MRELDPLELIATASRTGRVFDPREPRGTKGALTWADVMAALGMAGDRMGADMAMYVGAQDVSRVAEIQNYLVHYVIRCCNDDGITPDLLKVGDAVEKAMVAGFRGGYSRRGGSRYFRWAYGELMARAENAAECMARKLFREVA